jgi:uncharacterized protein (TIGR03118 family)
MSRLSSSAKALAVAAGLLAPPALAGPVALSDAQLGSVPAGIRFNITTRIADQPGVAPLTDPSLVNPWGLSQGPGTFLWVANNGTDTSTVYDPTNFAKAPLTVQAPGAPTGTTFVGVNNAFNVTEGKNTGSTVFAFATEGGQIEGWSPKVDGTKAIVAVDESKQGSEFKGLTLGFDHGKPRLFAANFGHNVVDVYNAGFTKVKSFTDPFLPPNYSPFDVQALNGQLYVTFAKRLPGETDETAGKGLGFVDVFDMDGRLVKRLVSNGKLNAPWGLAIAPQSWGKFAGALLVGNFGDGQINAYDPRTGKFLGRVHDGTGQAGIDGLWALHTGANGSITFSAGPQDESHGLVGSISPAAHMWGHEEVVSMAEMTHR